MRPALVADQQAVALGIVARIFRLRMHRDKAAIGVLRAPGADTLRDDPAFRVLAQMDHLCAGIGLLVVVGDRDRVELALAVISPKDAGRVLPRHGRPGFHLRPHHLRTVAPAIGALGHEVVDAALSILVAREPVLNRGILDLGIFERDQFHHRRVKLRGVALRRGAAFQIGHVSAFVGDDQRPLELAGVLGVDAEIGRQLHRAAHARRHIDEGSVREHGAVERRVVVVGNRHHAGEVLLHQFGVFADRLGDRAEDHASLREFSLECRAHRNRVEHRIHGDLAALDRRVLGALDTSEDHLLLQRDAQFLVCFQELGIDLIQRLGLLHHALGLGVIILILEVDLGIIDHRPVGFFHLKPAAIGLEAPLGHPLGLVILGRDQPHDLFGQPFRGVLHLDLGFPAVLVLAGKRADRVDRLLVDTFLHLCVVQSCHPRLPNHAARSRNFFS